VSSSGAIVTGYMTANVVCFTGSGGANQALTVTFGGTGTGTVSVSPGNLSCAAPLPCVFVLATGTLVTLTATPIGTSSFGTWANCDSAASVNPCTLTLSGNRTVTASFN
jgi:hypothetical protein